MTVNPAPTISGSQPVLKETKHWYLPLDKYEPWLKEWILKEHKEWKPNVYGQCKSWLDQGLHPRAVSRDLNWGIPVPVEGADGPVDGMLATDGAALNIDRLPKFIPGGASINCSTIS